MSLTRLARCAEESLEPGLWRQLKGLWVPSLRPDGYSLATDAAPGTPIPAIIPDLSGNRHDGVLHHKSGGSGAAWVNSDLPHKVPGRCLDFTGEAGFAASTHAQRVVSGHWYLKGPSCTLAAFVRREGATPTDMRILAKQASTATADHRWMMGADSGTTLRSRFKGSGGVETTALGTIPLNTWACVGVIWRGGDASPLVVHWVDGSKSTAAPDPSGALTDDADQPVMLGRGGNGTPPERGYGTFDGKIALWAVWDRALRDSEWYRFCRDPLCLLRARPTRKYWYMKAAAVGGQTVLQYERKTRGLGRGLARGVA